MFVTKKFSHYREQDMRGGEGLLDAFIITPEGKIFLWAIDV